jgi:hypothetical protein
VGSKLDARHGALLEVTGSVRLLIDGERYQGGIGQEWGRRGRSAW